VNISLEEIISLVIKEVIAELNGRGIQVDGNTSSISSNDGNKQKVKLGLSEYKTPLLTEGHILELNQELTHKVKNNKLAMRLLRPTRKCGRQSANPAGFAMKQK